MPTFGPLQHQCRTKSSRGQNFFTLSQIYIAVIEIPLTYTEEFIQSNIAARTRNGIGVLLKSKDFENLAEGPLAKIAYRFQRWVRERHDLSAFDEKKVPLFPCILQRIDPCRGGRGEIEEWEIEFFLPDGRLLSKRGQLSKLCNLFI